MKIAGVTLCFNESKMVKYVMPYWERMKIDKLIVYDNMSTDNTVELLKEYPFVEVRTFDTGGKFDDAMNSKVKSDTVKELKEAGYDWVCATDFDEVIYSFNPDFREELSKIDNIGGNVLCRDMIHPFTLDPEFEFDSSKLIHEQLPHFVTWCDFTGQHHHGAKVLMHNPKNITGIKFAKGQHDLKFGDGTKAVYFGYPFITFHLKYVDLPVLKVNSKLKHERMLWVFDNKIMNKNNELMYSYYLNMSKDDSLMKIVKKLASRSERYNTTNWEDLLKRYNQLNFIVNRTKQSKNPMVTRLDYDNIDMDIFYK